MTSEWKETTLRDAGITLIDCDHRTPPAVKDGLPYVTIPQMKEGRLVLSEARLISSENFVEWTRKANPRPFDIVLSRRCNPGETAFVEPGMRFALGQNLVLLRSNSEKVFPPFLRWLVRSPQWWEQVGTFINVGAVFNSLKCADIPKFLVLLPPLPEQEAIASVLGALDDKIELNRRMNATLEAIARALFRGWFVDFDPVRAKEEGRTPAGLDENTATLFPDHFQDSELGPIPQGWRTVSVRETCSGIFSGGTPSTKIAQYWNGGVPWLSSGETRNRFIIQTEKTISSSGVENSSARIARAGCSVVASAGQGHTRGQTSLLMLESYINQSVVALCADERVSSDRFLFFDLERRYNEFRQLSDSHSSRGSLTTKLVAGLKCVLPPHALIIEFDKAVGPLVDQIKSNLRQSRTLATLRDTLLPKLLNGELTPNS